MRITTTPYDALYHSDVPAEGIGSGIDAGLQYWMESALEVCGAVVNKGVDLCGKGISIAIANITGVKTGEVAIEARAIARAETQPSEKKPEIQAPKIAPPAQMMALAQSAAMPDMVKLAPTASYEDDLGTLQSPLKHIMSMELAQSRNTGFGRSLTG